MYLYLPLFLIFFASGGLAQTLNEQILINEKTTLEQELVNLKSSSETYKKKSEEETAKLKANEERLQYLDEYEKNFGQRKMEVLSLLHELKGRFYKCLRKSLEEESVLQHDYCQKRYKPRFKDEGEEARFASWKDSLGLPLDKVVREKNNLTVLIPRSRDIAQKQEEWYQYSLKRMGQLEHELKLNQIKVSEIKLLPKYARFTPCDADTPEINLENETPYPEAAFKGPFHGVPRDNQDGLGTCFANTAKNLIVGLSGGKDIASFLDLALLYKGNQNQLVKDGLDGGMSCSALDAAREKGYCPQHFSPLETGERNELGEGLFKLDKYEYLATNVNFMKNFLQDLSVFEKSDSSVKENILARSEELIMALKENKDIIFPVPVARFPVVEEWKLKEFHSINNLKNRIPLEDFLKEYRTEYASFYPVYVKSVFEGKSLDAIFDIYQEKMSGFISKYNFSPSLAQIKNLFMRIAQEDMGDGQMKKKLRASLDFLKKTFEKKSMGDDEFLHYCSTSATETLGFLSSIQTLVDKIRQGKIDTSKLFDENGKFKSAGELMQLTVAPSCLNSENRVKFPAFSCDNGYGTISKIKSSGKPTGEQIKMLREIVVLSLAQGYPLGNSFPTGPGSAHINTIAGMRFNPETKACEYLIRESQTGQSDWHAEKVIFQKIQGLTEVRRTP